MVAVSKLSTYSGLISGSDRAYVVGRIHPVLEEITISDFFARTVSRYPDPVSYTHLTLPTNREV